MGKPKLALAFILKDEGETIEEVIKTFWVGEKPVYDILVVGIDDSTKDNTEEAVRKFTEHIIPFKWENNFSKPRNMIAEECEKLGADYIFMPDGHEFLQDGGASLVRQIVDMNNSNHKIISPYILMMEDDTEIPRHIFPRPIFYRANEGSFWRKAVHNYVDLSEELIASGKDLKVFRFITPELKLAHRMPEKRKKWRNEQRFDMNVPGLYKQLEETKESDNPRDLFYMGNTLADGGKFEESIEFFEKCLTAKNPPADPDLYTQCCITLSSIYFIKLNKYDEAISTIKKAINGRWDRAEPYFYLAYFAEKVGRHRETIHWGEIAYRMVTENPIPVTSYFLDGRIYTWYPSDVLMTAYSIERNIDKALFHAQVVKSFCKENTKQIDRNIILLKNSGYRDNATQILNSVMQQGLQEQEVKA